MYVTDTHAFLWYLVGGQKLSKIASTIFDLAESGAETIVIPSMVLLESIDILDKKKILLNFEDILLKITQSSSFIISDVNLGLIIEVNRVKGLKDLHDRIIVATAILWNAKLISRDVLLSNSYPDTVVW